MRFRARLNRRPQRRGCNADGWFLHRRLCGAKEPLKIVDGRITVPDRPGLGIAIDMEQIETAHSRFQSLRRTRRFGGDAVSDAGLDIRSEASGARPLVIRARCAAEKKRW